MGSQAEHEGIDTTTASTARVYDYLLGGKDHYAIDREFAERLAERCPELNFNWEVRQNRGFMVRAIRHLAANAGMRQFLDIGTGLPTQENAHQVAQAVAPDARVVYVDNDPIVLAHARALLTSTPEGVTRYIDRDLRDPDAILEDAAQVLDFSKPVVLSLIAVLHFVSDPEPVLERLRAALAPGSHLVISHGVHRPEFEPIAETYQRVMRLEDAALRPYARIQAMFGGPDWEILDPGLVPVAVWRPDEPTLVDPASGVFIGGISRKVG